jgi:hypothetical protein
MRATTAFDLGRKGLIEMSEQMTLSYKLAMAAAQDYGNRLMKRGGRKAWSVGDYRRACAELERLLKLVEAEQ